MPSLTRPAIAEVLSLVSDLLPCHESYDVRLFARALQYAMVEAYETSTRSRAEGRIMDNVRGLLDTFDPFNDKRDELRGVMDTDDVRLIG